MDTYREKETERQRQRDSQTKFPQDLLHSDQNPLTVVVAVSELSLLLIVE